MDTIQIGSFSVNRIGLGTNRINDTNDDQQFLRQADSAGVNFIDTAHVYSDGDSETCIGKALAPYADGLVIATKGGVQSNQPDALENELRTSLQRLQTDCLDLYQLHRVDPAVPLTDTMQLLKRFQDEGMIKHVGLSEVSIEQLEEAMSVLPIVSVQNEYNVANRKHEELVDFCEANNIVFIPWFPLGGLRGDTVKVEAKLKDLADKYEATVQQVAIAWLLQRSRVMLPIPGTTSSEHLQENLRAADIALSADDLRNLE